MDKTQQAIRRIEVDLDRLTRAQGTAQRASEDRILAAIAQLRGEVAVAMEVFQASSKKRSGR